MTAVLIVLGVIYLVMVGIFISISLKRRSFKSKWSEILCSVLWLPLLVVVAFNCLYLKVIGKWKKY